MIAAAWKYSEKDLVRESCLKCDLHFKTASQCFNKTKLLTLLLWIAPYIPLILLLWLKCYRYCYLLHGYCQHHASLSARQPEGWLLGFLSSRTWRLPSVAQAGLYWVFTFPECALYSNTSVLGSGLAKCLATNSLQDTVQNCSSFKKARKVLGPNYLWK